MSSEPQSDSSRPHPRPVPIPVPEGPSPRPSPHPRPHPRPVRTAVIPCVKRALVRTGMAENFCRAHQGAWCAPNQPRAHGDVPRTPHIVPRTGGCRRHVCQVGAESPEKAHTWTGRRPQRGLRGRWRCQVGAESPEKAPTWTEKRPQRGLVGEKRTADRYAVSRSDIRLAINLPCAR